MSVTQLEKAIEEIEQQIADLDARMLDPEVYTDGDRCRELKQTRTELQGQLKPLEVEWASRAEST